MFELTVWKLKAVLYRQFRHRFPFGFIIRQEQQAIASLLQLVPGPFATVADIGTGQGDALHHVVQTECRIGIDQSLPMLQVAAQMDRNAWFVAGDAAHLPIRGHSINLILAIGLLEYFPDVSMVLREFSRIAADGAYTIISISPRNFWTAARNLHGLRLYPMSLNELTVLAAQHGFHLCDSRTTMMQQQVLLKKVR
jgi:ubiquinone/menaquinone biosynthesis C-methylase UbiE